MLTIRKETAYVGVLYEAVAIIDVLEAFLDTVDGAGIVVDSTLCTRDLALVHVDF